MDSLREGRGGGEDFLDPRQRVVAGHPEAVPACVTQGGGGFVAVARRLLAARATMWTSAIAGQCVMRPTRRARAGLCQSFRAESTVSR